MTGLTTRWLAVTRWRRCVGQLGFAALSGGFSAALAQDPVAANASIDVYEATVAELQSAMSAGRVTAVELVDAYLARIAAYDQRGPGLNAILRPNPEARADAARLDQERRERGPRGPLHGIPVIVKDNYDAAGMVTSGGSLALAGHRPTSDAHQVSLLREAGAIILAKSNLHELAYGITTVSSLGGQTRNPYDLGRNPGGSSGGTGAAIAASFATIGWGSDTCGSIRIPAAVNNLYGLRPTKGLSSVDGILPLSHSQDVGGPLARTVTDLALGLDATVGSDPADPATAVLGSRPAPIFSASLQRDALGGARIGVLLPYFGSSAEEEETNRLVRASLDEIRRLGAEVVEVEADSLSAWLSGTSVIDYEFKWDLLDYLARSPGAVRSLGEILESGLFHRAVGDVLRRSDRHGTRQPAGYSEAMAKREAALVAISSLMTAEGLDALAYPTLRRQAALIGQPAPGNNCALSAATGMPAVTVPAGFTAAGVPVGLELLGQRFSDAELIGFAYAYEQAVRPRRPPASTPPLGAGIRVTSFDVSATTRRPAQPTVPAMVRAAFLYDVGGSTLRYEAAISGVPETAVLGAVLREESAGPVIHRLVAPQRMIGFGEIELDEGPRQALLEGRLYLQLLLEGVPPDPADAAPLVLPLNP